MKSFKILKADIKNWRTIQYIQKNDGFSHAYYLTKNRIKRLFKRGELFFIAYIDKEAVGFTSVDFEIRARLHFLSVLKDFQKIGAGSRLVREIVRETKKRKYNHLYTITEKKAVLAPKFLKKFGFKEVGFHKNRFGNEKDAIIWSLSL